MQNRQRDYSFVVLCIVLFGSAGCQKSIPLDSLLAARKPNMSTQKSTQKLSLDEAIKQHKLEDADNLYLEYRGKHPDSSKIPTVILKLSKAHIGEKEYLLARYYAEAYITDYPDGKDVDLAWFLRLKALFFRSQVQGGAENLIDQFQAEASAFVANPGYKKYHGRVHKMLDKAKEIRHKRDEALARYYEKLGKKRAAAFYRDRNSTEEKSEPSILPGMPQ